jgi:hypothetical protein
VKERNLDYAIILIIKIKVNVNFDSAIIQISKTIIKKSYSGLDNNPKFEKWK